MTDFTTVLGLLLLAAVSALILKVFGFRGAPLIAVIGGIVSLLYYSRTFSEMLELFSYIGSEADVGGCVTDAAKVVGISYLSGISSDTVREMGESGIARCIGIVTKLELTLLAMPYIKEMLSLCLSLAEG